MPHHQIKPDSSPCSPALSSLLLIFISHSVTTTMNRSGQGNDLYIGPIDLVIMSPRPPPRQLDLLVRTRRANKRWEDVGVMAVTIVALIRSLHTDLTGPKAAEIAPQKPVSRGAIGSCLVISMLYHI